MSNQNTQLNNDNLNDMISDSPTNDIEINQKEVMAPEPIKASVKTTSELKINSKEKIKEDVPLTFIDRIDDMGLENLGNGCYHYADEHGEIVYRTLHTLGDSLHVDNFKIPDLGIFTRSKTTDEYEYRGNISSSYKFLGNSQIIENIKESISSIGQSILKETVLMNSSNTQMRAELIIKNPKNISEVGDIYPQLVIHNSYDGSRAIDIAFGISISENNISYSFGKKDGIGSIRQIHHMGSNTSMSTAIGGYIDIFTDNISELVTKSFEHEINETEMLKILDMIESTGKKRRTSVSEYLSETGDNNPINAWTMFLAITRFSTLENNLNAKKILENVAERVLIIPNQMISAVNKLREI